MPPLDKQAHFWCGWAIAATLYPIIGISSVIVAAIVGFAKEYWDKQGYGTPDVRDFIATALGGVAGAVVSWASALLIN